MQFTDLDHYDYHLPPDLIRRKPLEPRDSARLFVYDTRTDTITFDTFQNMAQYLPQSSLIVLNDTKVWPARLWLKKVTGGKIEVLILVNEWEGTGLIPGLVDRKIQVGDAVFFPDGSKLVVREQQEQKFFFALESEQSLETLLYAYGTTPIPHYLEGEKSGDELLLRQRYQTVFAERGASVAAPTASLHFTDRVFESLKQAHINTTRLTLNVGLGTFAPLREENFLIKKLHPEWVMVSEETAQTVNAAKKLRQPIVAVGTTITRSLEYFGQTGQLLSGTQPVDLFILPPYTFQMVDILVTNFHLPKTSLMLLVEAFLRHKGARQGVVELYKRAIEEECAFYSFGDSMLIL